MPDNFNWLESTKFTIEISHTRGLLGSATAKVHFEMEAGYKTAIPDADVALARFAEVKHEVELPEVADDAASYRFYYTINADNKDIYESDWFYVWPLSVDLTVKYKKEAGDTSALANDALVPGFPFTVSQVDEVAASYIGGPFKTTPQGKRLVPVNSKGPVSIIPTSPWEIMDPVSQADSKRKRELKVRVKPWVAKIRSHPGGKAEDAPLKQIVNVDTDYATSSGSLVKVEVGPEDLANALKDQEIYVRVTFPKTNCKRTTPFPALWTGELVGTALPITPSTAKPGVDELKYETKVKIPNDGHAAVFYVQVGVAGGDKCKIEVGVTNTYADDKLFIENWRKLLIELMVADPSLRQKCAGVLADAGSAFHEDLIFELDRIFQGTFIEFEYPPTGCVALIATDFKKYWKGLGANRDFDEDAAVGDSSALFVPRARFREMENGVKVSLPTTGGDNLFLLSTYQRRTLRKSKLNTSCGARKKNAMTWIMVDFIQGRSDQNVVTGAFEWDENMSTIKNFYATIFEGVDQKQVDLPFHVFDLDPLEASGAAGVVEVIWQATHYKKVGTADWRPIASSTDPCGAHKDPTKVVLNSQPKRDAWVELVDSITAKLKLPKTAVDDPGKLLKIRRSEPKTGGGTVDVEYDIKISADYRFYGIEFSALGGAKFGEGYVRTGGGRVNAWGMAQTLAHEIAHNCGQSYAAAIPNQTGGWRNPAAAGLRFGLMFPAGPYYIGKGHTGSHCANGLFKVMESAPQTDKDNVAAGSFAQPTSAHYTAYFSKVKQENQCIMYGSGPEVAVEALDFCDTCKGFLRATDVSNVSKAW